MKIPFFCSYIPVELLTGLGHRLVDISLFEPETCGSEYSCSLHDNICSYAKYLFRETLSSEAAFDFAVVPNTCDAMKKLHTVLALSGTMESFLLDVPRRSSHESTAYLAAQYHALLEKIAPGLEETEVLHRLQAADSCRKPLAAMTGGDLPHQRPIGVGVAGSTYSPPVFESILGRYDADACFLRHCGYGVVHVLDEAPAQMTKLQDLLLLTARNSLLNTICPRSDRGRMADFIVSETITRKLSGLILTTLKFCDFYAFEFERIRKRLPADFPLLYLENDLSIGYDEQNRTRIEAFMEKIWSSPGKRGKSYVRKAMDSSVSIGLDIGSATTKGVMMKDGKEILASVIMPTSLDMKEGAVETMESLLKQGRMEKSDVSRVIYTGYGRTAFLDAEQITEITCHALGVYFLLNSGATIIDVGGQDSKAIRMDEFGNVLRFAMNDKCAAGTGRFLESMVRRMRISFDDFSRLSLSASGATPISSMCSVFAESEVVSIMARGTPVENITRGLNAAIAERICGLVRKVQGEAPFVLTGGLSLNAGFIRELEEALGARLIIFKESQLAGAIGAAIAASGRDRNSVGKAS